jgi:hypothetical protein
VRCPATKQMPRAVLRHPVGAGEMGSPGAAGTIRLLGRIKVQHDPRNLFPVGAVGFGVEQAQLGDQVLFVVAGQNGGGRCIAHRGSCCISITPAGGLTYNANALHRRVCNPGAGHGENG